MPYKVFVDGDVLTASEVNEFMMRQQICVFADAAARDSAIVNPNHGQLAYLVDVNRFSFFNGTQWRSI